MKRLLPFLLSLCLLALPAHAGFIAQPGDGSTPGAGDLTAVQGTTNEIEVATGSGPVPVISLPATVDLSSKALVVPGKATADLSATAGSVARLTDGGAAGALIIGDGTNATLPEQKSQKIFNVLGPPFNAVGDGKVATDCSITAVTAALTCTTSHFAATDVGKVIAVYGAGPTTATFLQPLSTTIAAYVSATAVTLTDNATTTVSNSERVVWGTNNTTAIQAAVDAAADNLSGTVYFPPGHYLALSITLPCAKIGTWAAGTCTKEYNNIYLRGASRETSTIENWDITAGGTTSLIYLGRFAEIPALEAGNDRLSNITISDLTLREVKHATGTPFTIASYATQDVTIARTVGIGYSYECYVMGGGSKSLRWHVYENVMGPCGNGGPNYANFTSALNINGEDWTAHDNYVSESGQGAELGSHRARFFNNTLIGSGINGSIGINTGSTGSGIWDNTIQGNLIKNFSVAIQTTNTIGTINRTHILNNRIMNGGITIHSGLDTNSVVEGDADDTIHGTSTIKGNTFFWDTLPTGVAIAVGELGAVQSGLESVSIENNLFQFTKQYLDAGAQVGDECTIDAVDGTCRIPMGVLALAGPYGNATVDGYYPLVTFKNNVIQGPIGAVPPSGKVIQFQNSTLPARLHISNLQSNFPVTVSGLTGGINSGFNYFSGNVCSTSASGVVTCTSDAESKELHLSTAKLGVVPDIVGSFFSTPDSAAASITGDIDLRVYLSMQDWTPSASQTMISKWQAAPDRTFIFSIASTGVLRFQISADGTATTFEDSTVSTGFTDGSAHWVRVTRASASGLHTFYTSDDGLMWTQLGSKVTGATGGLFNGTTQVQVSGYDATNGGIVGKVLRAQIYNGIDGTLAVDFNPTTWTTGSTWVSATGETWTIAGGASISGMSIVTDSVAGIDFETLGNLRQFSIAHTASAVNRFSLTGAATGSGPALSAVGTDTNIDINLTPKGTGTVKTGTFNATTGFQLNGGALAHSDLATEAATTSGLTMNTARLLCRTTASSGAIEECSVDGTMTLAAGILGAVGSGSGDVTAAAEFDTDNVVIVSDGIVKGVKKTGVSIDPTTNVVTAPGFNSSDATNSGAIYLQGVTSGGVALVVADVAGTAIAYILPTTNLAAGQVLVDNGATTCPTLDASLPAVCHQLVGVAAASANTASAIVQRDGSGNFAAGTITATLSGNASTVTTNANLTGPITSTGNATAIAAGAVGATEIDETDDYVFTGTIFTATTVASLGTATAGVFKVVTDADPDCTTGSGSTVRLCRGNGTTWDTIGDGSGAEADTLDTVFDRGKTIDGANSLANAVRIGDGITSACHYTDATLGSMARPCTDSNVNTIIPNGFTWSLYDIEATTAIETVDPDAASTLAMWTYGAAYRPKKSIWFGAGSLSTDGTQCAAPAEVTPVASGPKVWSIICTDNDAATIEGSTKMPDAWDGGTVTFTHVYQQTAADTAVLNGDIACQARSNGEAPADWATGLSEVAIDDAAVTGSGKNDMTTSGAVTCAGTGLAGGDMLYFRYQLDATGTTTAVATLHHLGFMLRYSVTSRSD